MISGLTKNYYITSSVQKLSSIHRFILEIKQIFESQDLKGHSNMWPCAYIKYLDTMYKHAKNQLILLIYSWDTANYRVNHIWLCPPINY